MKISNEELTKINEQIKAKIKIANETLRVANENYDFNLYYEQIENSLDDLKQMVKKTWVLGKTI